jgi:hypothetical protein
MCLCVRAMLKRFTFHTIVLRVSLFLLFLLPWLPCSEIPMVFHLDVGLWGKGEKDLSKQFVRYWTQFAKYGNPNGNGTSTDPVWAPYGSPAQDSVAIFNLTEAGAVNITMASGVRSSFCAFWDVNNVPEWRVY